MRKLLQRIKMKIIRQEKMLTWTEPNQWMVVGNNIWIKSKNTRSAA